MKEKFIQPVVEEKERPETRVEKLFGNLKEQYLDQVRGFAESGLIEILPDSEELGYVDVSGVERVLPGYDEIIKLMEEKLELIEFKYDHGFRKLQIVPFGQPLEFMVQGLGEVMKDQFSKDDFNCYDSSQNKFVPQIVDLDNPIRSIFDFDSVSVTYPNPKDFRREELTKEELLEQFLGKTPGWTISLVENISTDVSDEDKKTFEGNRHPLPIGAQASWVEEQIDFVHEGETPFGLEDWIVYAILILKSRGIMVNSLGDESSGGLDSMALLVDTRIDGKPAVAFLDRFTERVTFFSLQKEPPTSLALAQAKVVLNN